MIEIVNEAQTKECFTNSVWVSLNHEGEANYVFESQPESIETHKVNFKAKDSLPEQNLFKLMKLGVPFSNVNMNAEFMLDEKSRLFRIQKELTQYLSRS